MAEQYYTAEEVAGKLTSAGFRITKRKINYYAFEKKMFQPRGVGKKVFSPADIDKIQGIIYLREHSKLSLEQIKTIINEDNFALDEIKRRYSRLEASFFSFATQTIEEKYSFSVYDRHLILDMNGLNVLIGTGVSISFGLRPLVLLAREHRLATDFIGADAATVSEYIGTKIDCILGGDILKDLHFTIDLVKEEVCFSTMPQDQKGEPLQVTLALNVPVIEIELRGNPVKLFLDTGAKVSYLHRNHFKNYPKAGTERDYYPGLEPFTTQTYTVPVKLAEANIALNFGHLPAPLEVALLMAGCGGIVGYDLFRYFNPIGFNLPGHLINLEKRALPLT
jgi:DNA-binding transcriptional MerR regulator